MAAGRLDAEVRHPAGLPHRLGVERPDERVVPAHGLVQPAAKPVEVLDEDAGVALRGLFIIDPDGVIMQSTINNLPVGRSVDETLRLLQAFQHIRNNPDEVCPANWTPGEKTMNPDPVKSKEFFAAVN